MTRTKRENVYDANEEWVGTTRSRYVIDLHHEDAGWEAERAALAIARGRIPTAFVASPTSSHGAIVVEFVDAADSRSTPGEAGPTLDHFLFMQLLKLFSYSCSLL